MAFFKIVPRDKTYLKYNVGAIPLRVIYNGVEVKPDFKCTLTELNQGYKHFKIDSGYANSFTLQIIIRKDDVITGELPVYADESNAVTFKKGTHEIDWSKTNKPAKSKLKKLSVITVLNYYMRHGTPFYIKSGIIGLPKDKLFLITDNPTRKQEYHDFTIWELTFTRYDKVKYSQFSKVNKGIQKAFKKAKSSKSKKVSATTKHKRALAKCKRSLLVYSKKKKVVKCIKTLQTVLHDAHCLDKKQIDGWYGKVTKEAVRKYQKKYAKVYGLKQTGNVNQKTYDAMIGKGEKIISLQNVTGKAASNKSYAESYKKAQKKKSSKKTTKSKKGAKKKNTKAKKVKAPKLKVISV